MKSNQESDILLACHVLNQVTSFTYIQGDSAYKLNWSIIGM